MSLGVFRDELVLGGGYVRLAGGLKKGGCGKFVIQYLPSIC